MHNLLRLTINKPKRKQLTKSKHEGMEYLFKLKKKVSFYTVLMCGATDDYEMDTYIVVRGEGSKGVRVVRG